MRPAALIETERLLLRPPTIDDFADVHRLWSTPEAMRHISGRPSTEEESWARLLRYIGHWAAFGHGFLVVLDKASGRHLGECGMMEFRRPLLPAIGPGEAGWVFAPEAWGQGIAFEAMSAVIAWFEQRPDAPEITCIIAPANTASIRLAGRLGFELVGERPFREATTLVYRRPRSAGTASSLK